MTHQSKNSPDQPILLARLREDCHYNSKPRLTITIGIVRRENDAVRNYPADSAYADLSLSAWLCSDTDNPYDGEIEYHEPFRVNLQRARTMSDTLKTLDLKLAKMDETEGYATTFGQRVNRFARAIGASELIYDRSRRFGWSYDDCEFNSHTLINMAWWIDLQIGNFKVKHNHKVSQSA